MRSNDSSAASILNMLPKPLKKCLRRSDGRLNPLAVMALVGIAISLLPVLFIVCFILFAVYEHTVSAPKAAQALIDLENECKSIEPLPQAIKLDYYARRKTSQALVSSAYKTNLTYPEIRSYYDLELVKHGWALYEERTLKIWGEDLGGKAADYCKGQYRATLEYAGRNDNERWTYSLGFSWGLEALGERYFKGEKYRSKGCRD